MKRGPRPGFTLIELLVVMGIIGLLLTLAVPRYFHSVDTARAAVLDANLVTMRDAIDKFFQDTGSYPDSLDELVTRRYLRSLPVDPLTKSTNAWIVVAPPEASLGRVFDVRSSAAVGAPPAAPHESEQPQ